MSKGAFVPPLEGQETPLSEKELREGTTHCEMLARQFNVFSNKPILMDKSDFDVEIFGST